MLETALKQGAKSGLQSFLHVWRDVIESTNFNAGCPVIAAAMEEATNDDIDAAREAAATVFNKWQKLISETLITEGIKRKQANALATMIIASTEGALAMCRATKDIKPFDQVTEQLHLLLDIALAQ